MDEIDAGHLASMAEGQLVRGQPVRSIRFISTDTRQPLQGGCFIPLVGDRFDGHDFLVEAGEKGAHAVLCAKDRLVRLPADEGTGAGPAVVVVDDTLVALHNIARAYRRQYDVPVIGVTGSNGKTTTKDMLHSMLSTQCAVVATESTLNNHIGVPLTVLRLEKQFGALIVEMGMNAPGEIDVLASIASPTIGVVTNVGPVHLDYMDGIDDVAREKSALIRSLPPDGIAVLNGDDSRVATMAAETDARSITFGMGETATIRAEQLERRGLEGTRFLLNMDGRRFPVTVKIPGMHHVMNALAAAAVIYALELPPEAVQEGLLGLRSVPMRMQVERLSDGIQLINDAFNASPLSVRAALETVREVDAAKKVVVLGAMLELGAEAKSLHRDVGASVAHNGIDMLVAVGHEGSWIAEGALEAGMAPDRIHHVSDVHAAAELMPSVITAGDVVLVKASRGIRLERVAAAIKDIFGTGGSRAEVGEIP